MILIDETKLTFETISLIARDYGIEYDYKNYNSESYNKYIIDFIKKLKYNKNKKEK